MKTIEVALVPSSQASQKIPEMMSKGLVDRAAKITKDGDFRAVPLLPEAHDEVIEMGFEISIRDVFELERRTPQEMISEYLSDIPESVRDTLPQKWEYVGDIVILCLSSECNPYLDRIGEVYAKVLGMSTVCVDRGGVSGEFRRPNTEVIFGTKTESIRLENGILYDMDVTEVMFASGNVDERYRMRSLDCTGETVVDMFAGIGYFTLPLSKFSGASKVIACEKNPDSFKFLLKNIELNGVQDIVEPILGDNRNIPGNKIADRILMGYVQTTSDFLPKAMELIRPGGIIHYHDTFYVNEYESKVREAFDSVCSNYEILGIHEVKSFAPSVSHYVADVRILD